MNQETLDNLTRSRIQMLVEMPFFGILAINLKLVEREDVKTAATDGKSFFYNADFINKLSEKERNFIVAHEVLHPALKHLWRKNGRQHLPWNCACDFAINLLIKESDPSGAIFSAPKGVLLDNKYANMTAEEIYDTFPTQPPQGGQGQGGEGSGSQQRGCGGLQPIDNHDLWDEEASGGSEGEVEAGEWEGRINSAAQAAEAKKQGSVPAGIKRLLNKMNRPQKNWRVLLNEFIIEFVNDYSFNPPDRRYDDGDFYLPDFNEVDSEVKDLVFWVDTSGSIGEKELNTVMSEIIGAIQQMNGRLQGYLGYFDAKAYELNPFETMQDVLKAPVLGGGGTCFHEPFNETHKQLTEKGNDVAGIIMLTDGYATFPNKSIANDIPVLWLITNEDVVPTFGLHTTVKINQEQ